MRRVFLHLHCFGLNNTLISSLAWHNAFASAVVVKHPNLYKLVQALKKEERLQSARYDHVNAGNPPTKVSIN